MIEGNSYQTVNIRSTPTDISSANIVGKLYSGQSFVGTETVNDYKNPSRGVWIKLSKINNVSVSGNQYVAGWVVNYRIIPDIPTEDLGVPVQVELTEKFSNGETRTTLWDNPTVVE